MKSAFALVVLAVAAVTAKSAPPDAGTSARDGGSVLASELKHPINIKSQQFQLYNKKHEAVFWGNVRAKRGTTDLKCNRMITHYASQQDINRIECIGDVEVLDTDRWAKGDHADFDNVTGVIVVTGNPVAGQGLNKMWGDKVTINLDDDTIHVDNVSAILETQDQQKHERKTKKGKGGPTGAADAGAPK